MASAATIAVFLLCCFVIASTDSQDVCDLYAATGTSVTVPLRYKLKESDTLRWRKDATIIFHRKNKKVIQGKNDDADSTGSLKLTQLTKDKSGRYTPEVHSADGVSAGDLQSVRLCVLDPVQKPTVMRKCLDSKTKVSFTCSVGQNENVEWFLDNKKLAEKEETLTRVASKVANARFSCNVSNPVSSEISLSVQQNCYEPLFPDELWGISIWVLVGGGAGIVLMLILIVITCCIQTRRKQHMRLKDEGEIYLQWNNQEQEQEQEHPHYYEHHYPQRQRQPADNTDKTAGSSNPPIRAPEPGTCTHCGLKRDDRK